MDLISQHFEADHKRLTALLKNYQEFRSSDFPRARENFEAFQFGLRRHMAWEEDVLFPLFERKTGIETGSATVTLKEHHREIVRYLDAMQAKLARNDRKTEIEEDQLLSVLEIHDRMEEELLYPSMDQLVTDAENAAAFDAIRAIPEHRYHL